MNVYLLKLERQKIKWRKLESVDNEDPNSEAYPPQLQHVAFDNIRGDRSFEKHKIRY